MNNNKVTIFSTTEELFQFAANDFMQRAVKTVKDKGVFSVVLSGGTTPKLFFATLTSEYYRNTIPWHQIQFFFGDERYVSCDDAESNYHLAHKYLFAKVSVNLENVYRIRTEFKDPKEAAADYEHTLRKVFQLKKDTFPSFDLLYLGLGDNAHTASLMPFSDVVMQYAKNFSSEKHDPLVLSTFVPELNAHRITLTPPAINHAKNIIFLVTGENKATAVQEVLEGPINPQRYPAQLIDCIGDKTAWYLDQEAAKKLIGNLS